MTNTNDQAKLGEAIRSVTEKAEEREAMADRYARRIAEAEAAGDRVEYHHALTCHRSATLDAEHYRNVAIRLIEQTTESEAA